MKSIFTLLLVLVFNSASWAVELPDFTDLIKQTSPAVVKINTRSNAQGGGNPLSQIPEANRNFFGFDFYDFEDMPAPSQAAIGSGFIISEDGYIVTNHHVIDGADEILVRLNDRREYFAEVIGSDEQSDLALIKVQAENLPTVSLATPDSLEPGDWVLAIGSPFDLDYSASAGIVSAIGRSLPNGSGQNYVPFIQTDVAINPGNSGGPLFNLDGEVVGVNSQIFTRSGGYMGLSFAIPVGVANDVIRQLKESGVVQRGWLGVVIQDVSQDLATSFGLDRPRGALISQVVSRSPAEAGGLEPGDIILEFNHRDIVYSFDLPHVVGLISPGRTAEALVARNGEQITMNIEVGALPGQTAATRNSNPRAPNAAGSGLILGMALENIDPDQMADLRISGGVIVRSVQPGSAAAQAGLAAGDVLVRLGFEEVSSVRDFGEIASRLPAGKLAPVRFYRDGSWYFRTINIE